MTNDKYRIDGHKLLWHLERLLEWQKGRLIPPVYLEVSPVSLCNHDCIFCGIDFARNTKHQLDAELFLKRIEEMGEIGIKSIMLAGEGEPLLHKDLTKFVTTTKNSDIDVSITTNGTLGDHVLWKEILHDLSWLRFSIDAGTSETYARVHRVRENLFNKTINSIEAAVKVKRDFNLKVTIGVQFLIIEENVDDIKAAISLFSRLGIDYFSLKPYSLHPQMIKKRELFYDEKTIKKIERIINRFKSKKEMNIIFRKDAMMKYMDNKKNFKHCLALPFWGYISSNGDFYTCSVFLGDERFKAGNIYDDDMNSIIFGDSRRNLISYGEKELDVSKECRKNCRMARINEFLDYLEHRPEHVNFV